MASFVWTDAKVVINSVDLSDHVKSVTLSYEAELQDETTMGTTTRKHKPGLLNWTLDVEFVQDFADNSVDEVMFGLVGAAGFPVAIRPDNDTISANNPEYQGTAVVATYPIMNGKIGDLAATTVKFQSASALVRDITS